MVSSQARGRRRGVGVADPGRRPARPAWEPGRTSTSCCPRGSRGSTARRFTRDGDTYRIAVRREALQPRRLGICPRVSAARQKLAIRGPRNNFPLQDHDRWLRSSPVVHWHHTDSRDGAGDRRARRTVAAGSRRVECGEDGVHRTNWRSSVARSSATRATEPGVSRWTSCVATAAGHGAYAWTRTALGRDRRAHDAVSLCAASSNVCIATEGDASRYRISKCVVRAFSKTVTGLPGRSILDVLADAGCRCRPRAGKGCAVPARRRCSTVSLTTATTSSTSRNARPTTVHVHLRVLRGRTPTGTGHLTMTRTAADDYQPTICLCIREIIGYPPKFIEEKKTRAPGTSRGVIAHSTFTSSRPSTTPARSMRA